MAAMIYPRRYHASRKLGTILVEKDLPLGGSWSYFKDTRTFDENLRSLPPDDFADVFDSPAGRYACCGTSGDDLLSTL